MAAGRMEKSLLLPLGFHQRDVFVLASDGAKVAQRGLGHGEDAAGCGVLRGHVGDGGAIGQRECSETGAKKFHELSDYTRFAKDLSDREDQVGGGGAFAQLST